MYNIEDRTIRIFISSTFEDMKEERDYLIEKTFPYLQSIAAKRDVTLIALDLRWGINEEQAKSGKVLEVCLNEIEHSHPFFIGLVGNRYGWVPTKEDTDNSLSLICNYAVIEKEIDAGLSITEIEFNHGALQRNEDEEIHAHFYVKNSPDSTQCSSRQKEFRAKVKNNGKYPVNEYSTIGELSEQISKDILDLLDKLYPEGNEEDFLINERLVQNAFLRSRLLGYVPDTRYYDALDGFVENEASTLVITGARGSGKSSLAANWINYRKDNLGANIIYFFIGNGSSEGDYRYVTRYIQEAVAEIYDMAEDNEYSVDEEADPDVRLKESLTSVYGKQKLVIVLDAVNQLNNDNNSKLLKWIPLHTPNVKFIISTTPDDISYQTLDSIAEHKIFIEPLNADAQRKIIYNYLSVYGKRNGLTVEQVDEITEHSIAQSPLVLRTFLDELIVCGDYYRLTERIRYYFSSESVEDFFKCVIHRYEEDFGVEFVRECLSAIVWSRAGMKEQELIDILQLKHRDWSFFQSAFRCHLISHQGLISFQHEYLSHAVKNLYITNETDSRAIIISYFERQENSARKYTELSYQYYHTDTDGKLYMSLLDYSCIIHHLKKQTNLLSRYWAYLLDKDRTSYNLGVYRDIYENQISDKELHSFYLNLGKFSYEFGDYYLSLQYSERALKYAENNNKKSVLLANISCTYYCLGDYDNATKYAERAISSGYKSSSFYNNLVYLYGSVEKYGTAHKYSNDALEYSIGKHGDISLQTARCHKSKAWLYYEQNLYDKAFAKYKDGLSICIQLCGEKHQETSVYYNDIANVYKDLKQFEKAIEYTQKAMDIYIALFGEQHKTVADKKNQFGNIYYDQEKYQEALEYCQDALDTYLSIFGEKHTSTANCYGNIANVYKDLKQFEKAIEYTQKAMDIYIALFGEQHKTVADKKNQFGNIYYDQEKYQEALEYCQDALDTYLSIFGEKHTSTANCYRNIGDIYYEQQNYDQSLRYLEDALDINRDILGIHNKTKSYVLNRIGLIYYNKDLYQLSLEYLRESLEGYISIYGEGHSATAMLHYNIGLDCCELGDYDEAKDHNDTSLQIRLNLGLSNSLDIANNYLLAGVIYNKQNQDVKALDMFQTALNIKQSISGEDHKSVANILVRIGCLYYTRNSPVENQRESIEYHTRALNIYRKLFGENNIDTANSYCHLGIAYRRYGYEDKALECFEKELDYIRLTHGENHLKVAKRYRYIAQMYQWSSTKKDIEYFKKELAVRMALNGEDSIEVAECYSKIGYCYKYWDDYENALENLEKALKIRSEILGEEHHTTKATISSIDKIRNR